ncbi:hypothetical protein LJR225_001064 [Phenylobacterium sp. LjRoot225]|uniref:hypothetical protein n=1 Tax=Phenylobacterium sp. LjRoot225 TaxID=3342285 RepID=UPI003ECEC151
MSLGKAQIAAAVLICLGGCQAPSPRASGQVAEGDAGYISPPAVVEATPSAGLVLLRGQAAAGAEVRLATPGGPTATTRADGKGAWRLQVATGVAAQIFGLSAQDGARRVQAEGYVLVGPRGETALLRAGAAALRLDRPAGSRIAALDFDAEGGALLSGWAAAGTDVAVRLDGRALGDARTDPDGRFSFAISRLSPGPHQVEATGVGFTDAIGLDATPAAPLVEGPLRSQLTGRGLRADWLTPGGGVQSTLLAG